MATIQITDLGTTYITCHIMTNAPNPYYYDWGIDGETVSHSNVFDYYTFDGLQSSSTHAITISIRNLSGYQIDSGIIYVTTNSDIPQGPPSPPPLSFSAKTSFSVTLYVGQPGGSWNSVQVHRYLQGGSTPVEYMSVAAVNAYVTFTNLDAGTTYVFYAQAYGSGGSSTYSSPVTVTTNFVGRPSNFHWTINKVSGDDFNISYQEWNDFTARINAFRNYKGLSSITFTTANSGGDFYATMFNQAVTAISAMSPPTTPPSQVQPGQDIEAEGHLNLIRDSLNSII